MCSASSGRSATTRRGRTSRTGLDRAADCVEVRVTLTDNERLQYAVAEAEEKYKLCSTAHTKVNVVKSILAATRARRR